MKIDTHIHSQFSPSSNLSVDFLIEQARKSKNFVLVCTDYADLQAFEMLAACLPEAVIVPAVEVETEECDVLVYSEDRDYIRFLCGFKDSVDKIRHGRDTALVWAHPCVSQHEHLRRFHLTSDTKRQTRQEAVISKVLHHVDALEVYNGTMLSLAACGLVRQTYFDNLRYLADRFHLASTGGSDAHETETWAKVWTEFPEPVNSVRDFIRAIKGKKTTPDYDRKYFPTEVGPDDE